MAQLHTAKADKNAVGLGAAPYLLIGKRPKAELIQKRLHIQKQAAAGYKINLKNVVRKRLHG